MALHQLEKGAGAAVAPAGAVHTLPPPLGAASPLAGSPAAAGDATRPAGQPSTGTDNPEQRELYGLFLNALATVFGTGMSLFAKISGGQGIGVFEIVLMRSIILVLFTGPDLLYKRVNPFKDPTRRWLLVLRGVLGFCSVSSLYLAVALLPLADASVLSFLSPIFVAVLGPPILKERSPTGVLLGIPVAMVGVVLVAQPSFVFGGGGGGISGRGVLVGVAQACFNALARMCVRALSKGSSEGMASIIFGQGAISCLGAGLMCAVTQTFRVPAGAGQWAPLLAGGLLGYVYQLALTGSLQRARVAPAVAMSVIWGLIADVLVFHNRPTGLGLLGATVICLSSFGVAYTQRRPSGAADAPAAIPTAGGERAWSGGLDSRGGGLAADVEADGGEEAGLLGSGGRQARHGGGALARLWAAASAERSALQLAPR